MVTFEISSYSLLLLLLFCLQVPSASHQLQDYIQLGLQLSSTNWFPVQAKILSHPKSLHGCNLFSLLIMDIANKCNRTKTKFYPHELRKAKETNHPPKKSDAKNITFKKPSKRNQNPSRYYYNSITNLKFQHKPKWWSFKNPPIKIDLLLLLLLLPRGPKSLKLTTILYNESKHNILAWVGRPTRPIKHYCLLKSWVKRDI